jgi:hypothetical protein
MILTGLTTSNTTRTLTHLFPFITPRSTWTRFCCYEAGPCANAQSDSITTQKTIWPITRMKAW